MGRRKVPVALHIARGNPSGLTKAELTAEPQPICDLDASTPYSAHLSPGARAIFGELVREAPAGLLKSTDAGVALAFAVSLDRWLVAQSRIEAGNMLVKAAGHHSGYRMNPYIRIASEALNEMLRCAEMIGCTPMARARLRGMFDLKAPKVVTDGEPMDDELPAAPADEWSRFTSKPKRR